MLAPELVAQPNEDCKKPARSIKATGARETDLASMAEVIPCAGGYAHAPLSMNCQFGH